MLQLSVGREHNIAWEFICRFDLLRLNSCSRSFFDTFDGHRHQLDNAVESSQQTKGSWSPSYLPVSKCMFMHLSERGRDWVCVCVTVRGRVQPENRHEMRRRRRKHVYVRLPAHCKYTTVRVVHTSVCRTSSSNSSTLHALLVIVSS